MQWTERIGRRLKLRDLHILLTVVQCGSMAKAGRALSVSHPVVSKAIADLEHALGVRLLDRTAQGVQPTMFGRALLEGSNCVFDDLKQTVKQIEFLADPSGGDLMIGATEPVAAGLLPAVIARIHKKYPRINYQVVQGDAVTLQRRELRDRTIELVLARTLDAADDPELAAEVLLEEQLCVVAGVRSPWASRRKLTMSELVDESWILTPLETIPGSPVYETFKALGRDLQPTKVLCYSLPLRASLLATGRFLTVVPRSVLHFGGMNSALKILPVELAGLRLHVGVITLRQRMVSPIARLFIDTAREVARPIRGLTARSGSAARR